jgi:8-oxo-dGTP pyrophosphatase MutT (NUDIX family)
MRITRDFVSTVFLVKDKKVLLVKHKKIGLWLPPGGHIENNETPGEAAVREVKEETGFDIELKPEQFHRIRILKTHHVEIHPIKEGHEHISFTYFTTPIGGKLKINHKESDELRWFSKEDLDNADISVEIRHFGKQAIDEVK